MEKLKIKGGGNMNIPVWILSVVGVIAFLLITPLRQTIIDLFAIIFNIITGTARSIWSFLRGIPAGTAGVMTIGWIGGAILILALIIILFVGGLYFTAGATILTISGFLGHWQVGFWLLGALLVWGALSVLPGLAMFRPLSIFGRWLARPIAIILIVYLVIVGGWWAFGNISPRLQGSIGRSGQNNVGEIANSFDKKSMKTEPEMGKFAKVLEESQIYNSTGQPVFSVQKGTTVLVKDLNGQKTGAEAEGMTRVMLPNRHGDFVNGNEGLISTRKLDWDWQAYDAKAKAEAEAKAKIEKAEAEAKAKAQAEAKALELRRQAEKIEAEKKILQEKKSAPIEVLIEKDIPYWRKLPAGNYKLIPLRSQVRTADEEKIKDSNGLLSLKKENWVYFYLPGTESGKIRIIPE